jgi:hypothetical protein
VCFSDEATFHVSEAVNRHSCRTRGNENPYVICELERGCHSERMVRLNARYGGDRTLLFGTDRDRGLVPGHAGAVCAYPVTTWNYLPTEQGTTSLQPYREVCQVDGSEEDSKLPGFLGHQTYPHWILSYGVM